MNTSRSARHGLIESLSCRWGVGGDHNKNTVEDADLEYFMKKLANLTITKNALYVWILVQMYWDPCRRYRGSVLRINIYV